MACIDLFKSLPTDRGEVGKRAAIIDKSHPDGFCECEIVSEFSSSVVADDEFVHRAVYSPIHLDDDGNINPAFFSDIKDKGLSCERSSTVEIPYDTHQRGIEKAAGWNRDNPENPKQRTYLGAVTANCGAIRSIMPLGSKVYAVYDTALEVNPAHVDVFEVHGRTPGEKKLARFDLSQVFSQTPKLD